jgi:hypothetical protein
MVKYSFEEFKLIYESAEKVTDRRLSLNKTNYSINIVFIAAIAFLYKWGIDNKEYYMLVQLLISVISVMSVLFCRLWKKQIKEYKMLNTAKFQVINEMAKYLSFESGVISNLPFEKEWDKLREFNQLQRKDKTGLNPLKSSSLETFMPNAFQFIFWLTLTISLISIIFNIPVLWDNVKSLMNIKKA